MPDTSIGILESRKDAKLDPLLDFKWACTSLPLGHDVSYVEEVELPFPQLSPKEGLFGAGQYTYYPAFQDINAFDITFYEDSKLNTTRWLKTWFERIRRPSDGAYYLPTNYKFDIDIALMDTTGQVVGEARLINVWPTSRGTWPLAYSGNDRLKVQQNFSVDNMEFKFNSIGTGVLSGILQALNIT
tara:strand:- start:40815 stop:41372 length:558 start_codon:yes stop_codon:yes gene_type:complete